MAFSLSQLMDIQEEFDRVHHGREPFFEVISEKRIDVLEHLIVCLVGELGELANIVKKVRRGDKDFQAGRVEMEEEIVDVFIYLMKISRQMGVDLERETIRKIKKNSERFRDMTT